MSRQQTPVILDETYRHWARPRSPGRSVRRRQMRKAGMFRPIRRNRAKAASPVGRIFLSPALPLIPSVVKFVGRKGGDR